LKSWTLDSGTTYHMTGDLNCLLDKKKYNKKIFFANGDFVKSKFIGTYKGYVNDNKIKLKNVLYVPEFKKNLISIDGLVINIIKQFFKKLIIKNGVIYTTKKITEYVAHTLIIQIL